MGAELFDDNGSVIGRQPAALVLFHEIGHGYRENFMAEEYYNDITISVEERKVIENYETPAASTLGHDTRTNHGGQLYPTNGPTSTAPLNIDNLPKPPRLDIGPPNKKLDYLSSAGPANRRE